MYLEKYSRTMPWTHL